MAINPRTLLLRSASRQGGLNSTRPANPISEVERVNAASPSSPAPADPPTTSAARIKVKLGKSVSEACIDSMTPQVNRIAAKPASPAQPCGANKRPQIQANGIQKIRFIAA